jgi:alpha-beta hydrolase superfamily lysophospholipase
LAGQDKLADPATSEMALTQVPQKLLTLKKYENNFHENFNEVNRNEIFNLVWNWMGDYLKIP